MPSLEKDIEEILKNLYRCGEPTYKFKVGDIVHIGNLINPTITEVLENGKIYKIIYSIIHNNYGNPYQEDGLERYVYWYNIRPINNETKSLIKNQDLRLDYFPISINSIISDYYYFGINLDPFYQRGFVWDSEDKEKLIGSIFNNVDIGKFVLAHKGYAHENMYEIIDGKQRLSTIIEYYENRFSYNGKYYNDLSYLDQNFFLDFPIAKAVIKNSEEKDIIRTFLLLNTTGKKMDKKHIENIMEIYKNLDK